MQLLFVVTRFGSGYLRFDLVGTGVDSIFGACAVDDSRVVFAYGDGLRAAEHVDCRALQLDTFLLADHGAACQNGDIFQHLFAAVAEARSLNGADLQLGTQTVDYQCCQSLAVHVLGDDQ